jgi:putative glutamine amidotransferase
MTAPLIGIVGRRKVGAKVTGLVPAFAHIDVDVYIAEYARSVILAGGLPVHLPLDLDAAAIVAHLDGLLLTGGADIDPRRYDEPADPEAGPFEEVRDTFELAVLDAALAGDIPVLGICRGMQLLNVHAGGSLHQHVPSHACWDGAPEAPVHPVHTVAGTRCAELYGPTVAVNSLHHQTLDRLGAGLVVAGTSPDGSVEAVELDGRDVLAVQWHPELVRPVDPAFTWLVAAATR